MKWYFLEGNSRTIIIIIIIIINNNNKYQDHLQHYVLAQKRDTDEAERQKNIVEVVRNR